MKKYRVKGPATGGENLWKLLYGEVAKRPIEVITEMPAKELIVSPKGRDYRSESQSLWEIYGDQGKSRRNPRNRGLRI